MLETPLLIGKRPLVVLVKPWGLALRQKGLHQSLSITWAQVWNRAAMIAAERKRAESQSSRKKVTSAKGENQ